MSTWRHFVYSGNGEKADADDPDMRVEREKMADAWAAGTRVARGVWSRLEEPWRMKPHVS